MTAQQFDGAAPHAGSPVSPGEALADLRPLMAEFPTGVAVVTAADADSTPWGMTCTSLCGIALSPPTLLVCLRDGSPTLRAVLSGSGFAMHLLHDRARHVAELFASGDPDRFSRVRWDMPPGARGPHLADVALMIADCTVVRHDVLGDHAMVIAEVDRVSRESSRVPLLHGQRRYAVWPR
ncbi:flavin reductase family protein [Jidongwangia harbinensis]|uniref:flavin reductase family protein n=1 Tax=Jidongwangia harbinensis TaxID=2878561 RepID=UPI001CDA1EB4|nr:flavin reductase family protein [Jidongwangia harbinensis]MCA2215104.1 flavin reductase family protein [Jidongwangia harbinensis]